MACTNKYIYIYIYIAYYKCADISTLFWIGQFLFRIDELLNCKFVNKAEIELTGKSHYIYYIYTYIFFLSIFLCFSTYCIHICILFRCVVSARRMSVQTILLLFFLFFRFGCSPNRRHNKYANIVGAYILRFARLKFICALNVTLKSRLSTKRGNNSAG